MAILLGIDYGSKKIGFATGQTITNSTAPLKVVFQNGAMWPKIDTVFAQWQPKAVVVGKPLLADGNKHPLEKKIESFIIALKLRYNAAVYRENEAYSSFEARFRVKNKKTIDAEAAAIILESWMNRKTKSWE